MPKSLGSLGDFFPERDIRCRVRGCPNTWNFSEPEAPPEGDDSGLQRPERICDECWKRYRELEDRQVPCATPGCTNTWTWTRLQQLEAEKRGRTTPPPGFCEACRRKLEEIQDRRVPCRMPGCKNTWTWTRRDQLRSGSGDPPARLCDECARKLRSLHDRPVPCSVDACTNTWTWNRFQQLEHLLEGKSLEEPPRRMCRDCFEQFKTLEDKQIPCKIETCSQTWTWTRFKQLEHLRKNGPDAPPPERMCPDCYHFSRHAEDRRIPCRIPGCKNTWTWTRAAQIAARAAGNLRPPRRLCDECAAEIAKTPDRPEPCMVPGCNNTWTYTAEEQVKDARQGKKRPRPRRCAECEEFLAAHPPLTRQCSHCGKEIVWSPYEQLLCARGTFEPPQMCADCAAQALAIKPREPAPPAEHTGHHVVKIPAAGPWHSDPALVKWPPHMTYEVLHRVEQADFRIVAFGDDLTFSSETPNAAWPALLEDRLNHALDGRLKVAVVNAGIPGTTTRQALRRFPRDVAPMAPHLVIFSFTFGDCRIPLKPRPNDHRPKHGLEEVERDTERLCRKLTELGCKLLFWTTNPMFPHDRKTTLSPTDHSRWAAAQESRKRHCLAEQVRICRKYGIPVLDLRSRFEVNGTASAKKWMADWYRHNQVGARHIASWLAEYIRHNDLLPQPAKNP